MTDIRISAYCQITAGKVLLNGQTIQQENVPPFGEFIRLVYKAAGMSYPKFYKMDDLCKLALVATEHLLKENPLLERHAKENIGLIIQNASSTYDTDATYQASIDDHNNYFPSPAVFVYTLPNIMLGEICIKHKLFGENALMIAPSFDPEALTQHLNLAFVTGKVTACITGWIELNKDHYEAFLMLAEKTADANNASKPLLSVENINNLHK